MRTGRQNTVFVHSFSTGIVLRSLSDGATETHVTLPPFRFDPGATWCAGKLRVFACGQNAAVDHCVGFFAPPHAIGCARDLGA